MIEVDENKKDYNVIFNPDKYYIEKINTIKGLIDRNISNYFMINNEKKIYKKLKNITNYWGFKLSYYEAVFGNYPFL